MADVNNLLQNGLLTNFSEANYHQVSISSVNTTAFHYYELYENSAAFWKDIVILVLYSITSLVSLFGNTVVCYVAFVLRSKSTTYLLIGNMAVSDLISALVIPLQWGFCSTYMLGVNERFCGTFKSLQVVSYFISTFTMALIAIDRYMILKNPLARRMHPVVVVVAIWLTACLLNIPTLFAMRVSEYFTPTKLIHCRIIAKISAQSSGIIRKYRVLLLVLSQYFIPLVVASIFYGLCIQRILSRQRIGEHTDVQQAKFYQSRMRTIKMLLLSLCAFMVGWFPVHLIHLVDFYIHPLLPKQCNSSFYYNFFYWISISSCCYNPFIYCWFDQKFRSTARLFCFGFCVKSCPSQQRLQIVDKSRHTTSARESSTI